MKYLIHLLKAKNDITNFVKTCTIEEMFLIDCMCNTFNRINDEDDDTKQITIIIRTDARPENIDMNKIKLVEKHLNKKPIYAYYLYGLSPEESSIYWRSMNGIPRVALLLYAGPSDYMRAMLGEEAKGFREGIIDKLMNFSKED